MPAVLKVAVVFGEPVAPNANEGEALVVGLAPTAGEAVKAPPKRGLPLGESVPPVLLLPFHPPGVKLAPPVALMEGENAVVREGTKGEGEEEPLVRHSCLPPACMRGCDDDWSLVIVGSWNVNDYVQVHHSA